MVGPYGLGIRNMQGGKLVEWCHLNKVIMGTHGFSNQQEGNALGKAKEVEADYVLISKRVINIQ